MVQPIMTRVKGKEKQSKSIQWWILFKIQALKRVKTTLMNMNNLNNMENIAK